MEERPEYIVIRELPDGDEVWSKKLYYSAEAATLIKRYQDHFPPESGLKMAKAIILEHIT